jgi:hypothetical protein
MRKVQLTSNILQNFKPVLCIKNVLLNYGTLLKKNAYLTRISMRYNTYVLVANSFCKISFNVSSQV